MKVRVQDQGNNHIGELLLPVTGKQDADVALKLGDRCFLDRIDTPDGFYYLLKSSYASLKDLTEFTPATEEWHA